MGAYVFIDGACGSPSLSPQLNLLYVCLLPLLSLQVNIATCTFDGNAADNAGGALYLDNSASTIDDSKFLNNVAGDDLSNDQW